MFVPARARPLATSIRALPGIALLCLLYFIGDHILNGAALGDGWTIMWPLNGITIGLLLTRPRAEWPLTLTAIALGTGWGEFQDTHNLHLTLIERLLSIAEVLLSTMVLPPFVTLDDWLRSPRLSLRFCAALLCGPGITGIIDAAWIRHTPGLSFFDIMNNWATSDALGIAATLPLVLSMRTPEMRSLFALHALPRTLGILAFAEVITGLIFHVAHPTLLFLLYPALLAVDLTLGFAGASLAAFGACLLSASMTVRYPEPLTDWSAATGTQRDLFLQAYLGFHLLALLPASIVLLERRRVASQLVDANTQLALLASLDGLTGIANRRTFDERYAREWNAAIRQGIELALIMIDIDYFKLYNDCYGHPGGDACLRTIATQLLDAAARPQYLYARNGGEELVILLQETSLDGAIRLAERLRVSVFDHAIEHRGSPIERLTLSIGCAASRPLPGDTSTRLLELADQALYQAKQSGRNTVCVLSPHMQPFAVNQIAITQST